MKTCLLLVLIAITALTASCGDELGTPTPGPTPTPAVNFPLLNLTAELLPERVRVGDTFVISTDADSSGLAQYRLAINRSTHSTLAYDGGFATVEPDPRFRLEKWVATANLASWTFVALEPGEYPVNIFVTGEVSVSPDGPHLFTHGERDFTLVVDPA